MSELISPQTARSTMISRWPAPRASARRVFLVFGLVVPIALMGAATSFIAGLLRRHRWIAYVGLAITLYVALRMTWGRTFEVQEAIARSLPRRSPLRISMLWWSFRQ